MRFLLVCEGSLDTALLPHIQRLLTRYGYPDSPGEAWSDGRRLVDKVRNGLQRLGQFDLLFVHRDADNAGANPRYYEIENAIQEAEYRGPWVAIVPVRMTEAWILLDEAAIRRVVRRPDGRTPLALPTSRESERMADPKTILETVLLDASETRGRRRREIREDILNLSRQLLRNLPVGGPLGDLESWSRFRDDTVAALQSLAPIP